MHFIDLDKAIAKSMRPVDIILLHVDDYRNIKYAMESIGGVRTPRLAPMTYDGIQVEFSSLARPGEIICGYRYEAESPVKRIIPKIRNLLNELEHTD